MRHRTLVFAFVLAACAALGMRGAPANPRQEPGGPSEYEVKAAFLYNFAKFVDWPSESLPADGTFTVCVLGPDPFGRVLDETLEGKTVLGRRIVIRRTFRAEEAVRSQIVFIGSEAEIPHAATALAGQPTLTVGDGEGLAERGVMIAFRTRQRKVRFEINLERAEAARLKLSSQLLKLALLVPPVSP